MRVRGVLVALALTLVCAAPGRRASPYISPASARPGPTTGAASPTAAHPYPVVLVHGTFGDMTVSWNLISPRLKQDGYCVFALDYGHRAARDPIEGSARPAARLRQPRPGGHRRRARSRSWATRRAA